jgi:hypothetical protein
MATKIEEEVIDTPVSTKKSTPNLNEVFPGNPALVKALNKAGIETEDDLKQMKVLDLLSIQGIGQTRATVIIRSLANE